MTPDKDATGVTQSHHATRLPSNASTAAVWSGEEDRQVRPLLTLHEEHPSADDSDSNLSGVSIRQRHRSGTRKLEPFYIYNEFVRLRERAEHFCSETSILLESVDEEAPLATRVQAKVDHYNDVVDQLEDSMNDLIWDICQGNSQPLPGSPKRWRTRLDFQKQLDDAPPVFASTPTTLPGPVQEAVPKSLPLPLVPEDLLSAPQVVPNSSAPEVVLSAPQAVPNSSAPEVALSAPQAVPNSSVPDVTLAENSARPEVAGITPSSVPHSFSRSQAPSLSHATMDQFTQSQIGQPVYTRPVIIPTGFRVSNSYCKMGTLNTTAQAGGPAQTLTVFTTEGTQAHPTLHLDNANHHPQYQLFRPHSHCTPLLQSLSQMPLRPFM